MGGGEDVRIAFDIDGVLADCHSPFITYYNDVFGTDFAVEDVTEWDFGVVRDHFESVTGEGMEEFMFGVDDSAYDGFMGFSDRYWIEHREDVPLVEDGAATVFDALQAMDDVEVDIVTARFGVDEYIMDWLSDQGIDWGEQYESFVTAEDKHELEYDLYVEDNPYMKEELETTEYEGHVAGLLRPWNEDVFEETAYCTPIESLSELPAVVDSYRTE